MVVAKIDHGGGDRTDNYNTLADFIVSIPPKGLSQCLCSEEDAESHWLHIWNNLVGFWSQSHCIFDGFSCKYMTSLLKILQNFDKKSYP